MKDLTIGRPGQLIFQFTIPMLIGNIFQQLYNVIDSIVVGHYVGKTALAAVGASFPLIFILIALVVGITMGFTIMIAQYYGAKDMKSISRTVNTASVFLLISSIATTIVGFVLSEFVFRLISLPEEVIPEAIIYFRVFLTGMIFFFGYNGIAAILRGLGDSKTPLYFLIVSTLLNIVLAVLFVGVFEWGIAGSAWATVVAQAIAFAISIVYLNRKHEVLKIKHIKFQFDRAIFKRSMNIGLPSGLQQTFVAIGMLALLRIVNQFGTNVVAAYTVAGRIETLATMPAMNFGAALSTFTGQNLGAGKLKRVRMGLGSTFLITNAFALGLSAIIVIFRRSLMHLFTPDLEVVAIGSEYLLIVASFYALFATMFAINGVMRGAGDTLVPMFITLFSLWLVRIPLAWILSKYIGVDGIWWAIPIAWFIGMCLSYIYYKQGNWRKKVVTKSPVSSITVEQEVN